MPSCIKNNFPRDCFLNMANWLQRQWTVYTLWHVLLIPLSWLFLVISFLRRSCYKSNCLKSYRLPVPVVVVGNINVGGTGKTPLVIWLAEQLRHAGYKPGIISRGYGGRVQIPQAVFVHSDPRQVGDEPVLIAHRTGCPVFVSADRVAAGRALFKAHPECNVIISDDGLQHYRLQRDVELIVFDSVKGFGNESLLPAGPLRESIARLKAVDAVVSNGKLENIVEFASVHGVTPVGMQLQAQEFVNLADGGKKSSATDLARQTLMAVAGIGNPERFFQQLRHMGLSFQRQAFPDHYEFTVQDFELMSAEAVIMTEKDAVKCRSFAKPNFWVLPVKAVLDDDLIAVILNKLRSKK